MVRAIVLGCLLPVTEDLEADLRIFEQLMAITDESFSRREPKLKVTDLAARISLENPWDFFDYTLPKGKKMPLFEGEDNEDNIANLTFPLQIPLKVRWKRGLADTEKQKIYGLALEGLIYEEKVNLCKQPEELDPEMLYGPIWPAVNAHLGRFGISAQSHQELVEQLGILRFGHRPKVGDTFCGGGSIPFEAARLGCDVYASDLNPVACMLTWGALNIIGASPERRAEIEQAQREVAEAVDREIVALGIEHNERGDRAKAYLYCLETRCPETGWLVPMAPSWVISLTRNVYAKLIPEYQNKRFDIEIITGASEADMVAAQKGTVQDGNLVYELDGKIYQTSIKTIRGDYKDQDKVNRNKLRQWEKSDFKPRPDDIFQERLYCIQWMKTECLDKFRPDAYFASVTNWDLANEKKVEEIVEKNLSTWQEKGLVPDMMIEHGHNTSQPIWERGWRYWHHLFNARHLHILSMIVLTFKENPFSSVFIPRIVNRLSKLTIWAVGSRGKPGVAPNGDFPTHVFTNQALNTQTNYGQRSYGFLMDFMLLDMKSFCLNQETHFVQNQSCVDLDTTSNLWITDPPYADAVNYEEITEFFIAWLRKNPPPPFDQWIWDSRRSLAIKGDGEDFRRGMVAAYSAMTQNMPDNGLQCVMFTHQDTSVWSDMVSIFWAAGLQVVSAWYIATKTSSALKQGGYVQGTVTLLLRKRLETASTFKQRLLPKIRQEVAAQIEAMLNLNEEASMYGESVFNDSDLQMAGYAAAMKVLTQYTVVDGRDVTALALQPHQKGENTVVDDIVQYASEIANNLLIPERLKALNPETWGEITGVERFYLRMLAIEQTGASKLDHYQNFAKAFHVAYQPLMASLKPNNARLKVAMAQYIGEMLDHQHPQEAQKAQIISDRIRNEGLGT